MYTFVKVFHISNKIHFLLSLYCNMVSRVMIRQTSWSLEHESDRFLKVNTFLLKFSSIFWIISPFIWTYVQFLLLFHLLLFLLNFDYMSSIISIFAQKFWDMFSSALFSFRLGHSFRGTTYWVREATSRKE